MAIRWRGAMDKYQDELNLISTYFAGKVPIVFKVMAQKDILSPYAQLTIQTLSKARKVLPETITHGLMTILSSKCANNYCFVSHSFFLYGLGLSVNEIQNIVFKLSFPESLEDKKKWDNILRMFFFSTRIPQVHDFKIYNSKLFKLLDEDELLAVFQIYSLMDSLNRFSDFYYKEITIGADECLNETTRIKLPVADFAKYYEKVALNNLKDKPVVLICSYCKSICTQDDQWLSFESALSLLDPSSVFSHGICEDCYEQHRKK